MLFLSPPLSCWDEEVAARLVLNPTWLQYPWVSLGHPKSGLPTCNIPFSSSYKPGSAKNIRKGKGTISLLGCRD